MPPGFVEIVGFVLIVIRGAAVPGVQRAVDYTATIASKSDRPTKSVGFRVYSGRFDANGCRRDEQIDRALLV
jgi:hypothetical protein